MKIKIHFTLLAATVLLAGCSKPGADPAAEKAPADGPSAKPAEMTVKLDADAQKRIGLEVSNPVAAEWQREIRATGRVLDPAPLLDLLITLYQTEKAFDASLRELDRGALLKKDKNISERAFQDLETTYQQNGGAVGAIYLKIQTGWGSRIAEMTGPIVIEAGAERKKDAFLAKLPEAAVLIRVDLPAGQRLENTNETAMIISLMDEAKPATASYFDALPAIDAQSQQQGIFFAADRSPTNRLTPGEAVTAFIKSSDAPVSGVTVPAGAILRHEGKGWVYVQTGTNFFTRQEISLARPVDGGFFSAELSPTNRVVVTGAQTLLSAELSGGGFNSGQRD